MTFNSIDFLIFFPIVIFVYFFIPNKIKHYWLLIASYYFYMCWNAKYALLILSSTAITYASGLTMEIIKGKAWDVEKERKYKKIVVAFSFALNLAILFWFKYLNFALGILTRIFARFHIGLSFSAVDILLPVGISFYTFQALSYTMDVYRDEIYAEKDFFRYALFVSFFPQLVAGPIERSKSLLRQLAVPAKFQYEAAREGVLLMLWGFFLKMVIADRTAVFVDIIYGDLTVYAGWYLVLATILFAFQIYCDFMGYSTIAMGAAKVLGIDLMENFDAPYLSASIGEFWKRWHISLTSWFKDYLYIPLGGSRKGKLRKYINKMLVFLISGLWHGARFSYVIWGGLNGLCVILGEFLQPVRDKLVNVLGLHRESLGHRMLQTIGTFLLFDFSLIFFRANSFREALTIIKSILRTWNPWVLFDGSLYECGLDEKNFTLLFLCLLILLFADCCKYKKIQIRAVIVRQDVWFRCLFIVLAVTVILLFGMWGPSFDKTNFIYFQF